MTDLPLSILIKRRKKKRRRPVFRVPELTIDQILAWADEFHESCGRWPNRDSGRISGSLGETWQRVNSALRFGLRGLQGASSLARLLAAGRGVRNIHGLPKLTIQDILTWADAHFHRTRKWPTSEGKRIVGTGGETWMGVHSNLARGGRGLPGGSSLARLLAKERGTRNPSDLPKLSIPMILKWADDHFRRVGVWPTRESGPIPGTEGETWKWVEKDLRNGYRGLPGGSSLARLLAERRGRRNRKALPSLTVQEILTWADAHFHKTGTWPIRRAGVIPGASGNTWKAVDEALKQGTRGLPGGSSLARLLAERRGKRNRMALPRLTVQEILTWADAHFRQKGAWPTRKSEMLAGQVGDTWMSVDEALRRGTRGLPGGSSLARVLDEHRGVRNRNALPKLRIKEILSWLKDHFRRTGKWPTEHSGLIPDSSGETWAAVESALRNGVRGLPGGSSLFRLRLAHFSKPVRVNAIGKSKGGKSRRNKGVRLGFLLKFP